MEESTFALVRYAMKFRIPSTTYFLIARSRLLLLSFGLGATYLGKRDRGQRTFLGLLNSYLVKVSFIVLLDYLLVPYVT